MQEYPAPARPLIARMKAAALAAPERTVAFQGAPGANSHIAALEAFPDCLPLPCFGFGDAIDAVREGIADCAIIPIENSQHGRVADMHFLLPESGLVITGEHFLAIRHALMSVGERNDIRQAISHEQAIGQCRHWLAERDIVAMAYPDTAGAAARVKEMNDSEIAALAPPAAAELYGLNLHESSIADADHNMTRFVVLAREAALSAADRPMMTTLMFAVKNIPAALYKALGAFATNGVNITKLESYQRAGSFSASEFYCDIEGAPGEAHIDRALEELGFQTKWLRLLGTYPRARKRGA